MAIGSYNSNYVSNFGYPVKFGGQLQESAKKILKPVDKVETIVNDTVDTFVPESEDEENKKSRKNAVRAFSAALVLTALVALFNPKFSSKITEYLKKKSAKAGTKASDESLSGLWNKFKEKTMEFVANGMQIANNFNTCKDEGFKLLCSKTKFLSKPHDFITKNFDKISKHTVHSKYKKVTKNFENLDSVINKYLNKLTPEERKIAESKLKELSRQKEFFSAENIERRLVHQESIMSDLENKAVNKMKEYGIGVFGKNSNNRIEKSKDVFNFWAQDILMPKRKIIENQGIEAVNTIVGDGKSKKGTYQEILDILSPHLKNEEKAILDDYLKHCAKKLKKANNSECVEYFDKKRDLVLGSAPTDVVTTLFWLGVAGTAIGRADTKEERISKSVTSAFPVVAGAGVSLLLTAKLVSGGLGIALGALSSGVLSLIGSGINKFLPKPPQIFAENSSLEKGVQNA